MRFVFQESVSMVGRSHSSTRPRKSLFWLCVSLIVSGFATSCARGPETSPSAFSIPFQRYALANGLDVVLHVDRSDPVVAVAMTYHVGSSREQPGKTGLAHLFEHLLFLDSENLGPGGLDHLIDKVGGSLNGFTDRDRTTYYEVVPGDALEKVLWAEADRLGYFINTVTADVLEKEKQVVKNEKRQSYDNQPYGQTYEVIGEALYPEGHPYSWQTIGSFGDLDRLSLEDVRDFYQKWYAPNNATLVLAGDFDLDQTREWIERYFGEIPASPPGPAPTVSPVEIGESRRLLYEDRLATLPELTLTWPTVPLYHPDSYALELLASLLSEGKTAPLYQVVVQAEALAPSVDMYTYASELAGEMSLAVRGFEGTDLDDIGRAIRAAFARFENEGVSAEDVERLKAGYEIDFYTGYRGVSSVLGQAFKLSESTVLAGSPDQVVENIERLLSVKEADIARVYREYIKDKPFIATSFVPTGRAELALEGSVRAEVEAEVVDGEDGDLSIVPFPVEAEVAVRTPSRINRAEEPPFGPAPSLHTPDVWTVSLDNGLRIFGIEAPELPVVRLSLRLEGGMLLDDPDKVGVANLTARLMNDGTSTRTAEELEGAIELLGASIDISADRDSLTVSVSALRRNYEAVLALVREMLLEPRWDLTEFELEKQTTIAALRRQEASPDAIADNVFNRLLYGQNNVLSRNVLGSVASVDSITLDDLKAFYQRNVSPEAASVHVVGDISRDDVVRSLAPLVGRWAPRPVDIPDDPLPSPPEEAKLFFVDVPGSTQSVIRVGALALAETDEAFYPATIMNLRLGGAYVSELVQTLREERGYTYDVSSSFTGSRRVGPFAIRTRVRADATFDAMRIITDILDSYPETFDEEDLEASRSFLIRSNARMLETLDARVRMLEKISSLGLPFDYLRQREQVAREITLDRIRDLASRLVNPEHLLFLVVGDARTQLPKLAQLGLGPPILIEGS